MKREWVPILLVGFMVFALAAGVTLLLGSERIPAPTRTSCEADGGQWLDTFGGGNDGCLSTRRDRDRRG
jgi:hypothetical protein